MTTAELRDLQYRMRAPRNEHDANQAMNADAMARERLILAWGAIKPAPARKPGARASWLRRMFMALRAVCVKIPRPRKT